MRSPSRVTSHQPIEMKVQPVDDDGLRFPPNPLHARFRLCPFPFGPTVIYARCVLSPGDRRGGGNDIKTRPSMLARFVASSSFLQIKGRVMQLQLPSVSRRRGVR